MTIDSFPELDEQYRLWIDGEYVDARDGDTLQTVNPATEDPAATVAAGKQEDVDRAVQAARDALDDWQDVDARERGRLLRDFAERVRNSKADLIELETVTNGKQPSGIEGELEWCANYFDYYAGITDKLHGEQIPRGDEYVDYTIREPLGVIGQIVPWNLPIQLLGRGVATALATGNAVVAKPAEETPLAALKLAELLHDEGLPTGLFNVVTGRGEEAGAALASHPDIDGLAFTGSGETGRDVLKAAAENIVPAHVELGGKSPNVIYPDADFDEAIEHALNAIFRGSSGQGCTAGSRLLVHEDVHDEFVERLADRAQELTHGPGIEEPDMSPIISASQFERVLDYIRIGREEVGEPMIGGSAVDREGYFVEPTIFADVDNSTRIAQEEIFGPVLCTISFASEEEAIRIANDTRYGLAAAIFTNDLARAHRFAREVDAGQIYINEYYAEGVETPFGGYKESGIGREKGLEAIQEYTQVKNVCARID